jgi:hypothetical protein
MIGSANVIFGFGNPLRWFGNPIMGFGNSLIGFGNPLRGVCKSAKWGRKPQSQLRGFVASPQIRMGTGEIIIRKLRKSYHQVESIGGISTPTLTA